MDKQTNEWMNEWMDKAMGEGYLCNSRIYVLKVLLHQLVNEWTNKWMNERTSEWVFVRRRFCKSRINVLKVLLQICTVAFSFPPQPKMMCVFTKQQSHTLWKVFRGNSGDWKTLTWQNIFDICSRDHLSAAMYPSPCKIQQLYVTKNSLKCTEGNQHFTASPHWLV